MAFSDPLALTGAISGIIGAVAGMIGAITGGIALVMNRRSNREDRPHLALEAHMGQNHPTDGKVHVYLELIARNTGRRVIHIDHVFVNVPPFLFPGEAAKGLPMPSFVHYQIYQSEKRGTVTLREHEKHVFRHAPFDEEILSKLGDKVDVVVEDTLGHVYNAKCPTADAPKRKTNQPEN